MKSREEIEELKRQWRADPIWDLANTEYFEAHRDELRAYQQEWEKRWREERRWYLIGKAQQIGCPGNVELAAYVDRVEARLAKLEKAADEVGWRIADAIGDRE